MRIIEEIQVEKVYDAEPVFAPKEGETVIDVGAHIGVYSLHAAKAVGRHGFIVAVEADPNNFSMLKRNSKLTMGARIICVETALWNCDGKIKLYRDVSGGSGRHSVVFEREGETISVKAETLDGLVRKLGLRNVSFIKMDVEGAAFNVLKGGQETLLRCKPRIACAAYHTPDEASHLGDFLRRLGYDVQVRGISHSYTSEPELYVFARAFEKERSS